MPERSLDELIARVLSDSACSISLAKQPIAIPQPLPSDVRQFFSKCSGGGLYYGPDYRTPQFGCTLGYAVEQPVTALLPCEGPKFASFYTIGEFTAAGEHDCVVVSGHPEIFGHVYRLSYSLGSPALPLADAQYLAPTFTRWLAMHVEAWDVYVRDWREGLRHFSHLIENERNQYTSRAG